MRRSTLIVLLTVTLAFGSAACGLKESDDASDLSTKLDPSTEPDGDTAGPATDDPAAEDDLFGDPSTDDDAFGDDGSGDDDPSSDDGSGSDSSGDGGTGSDSPGGGGSGDDFCSLAGQTPDPTDAGEGEDFLEQWRDSAPEELRDEVDVIVNWYQQSLSDPTAEMSQDVLDALIAISQYTIENCS